MPNPRPSRFIRLVRVGGGHSRELDRMLLVVECWAPDGVQAELDALTVSDALRTAPSGGPHGGGWVTHWDTNTIADFADPEVTTQARFTVTGTLVTMTFN
ncbi:hypothetical protein [Gordonia sp. (in: high G+C Gram-positive bacteria)]|uniref:hypothetical protein n=1 Tax=Gordonia sp. (in: high G+C Gram-positive bacteria) TaxID=84139 RepID=UPI003F9E3CCC